MHDKPAIAVALTGWNLEHWLPRLRHAVPGREIAVVGAPGDPLPERYYLFCWKPDPGLFRQKPAPLLILSGGAGVDHILDCDPPEGIPITRIVDPDLTGRMVEYIVLHSLYHLRRMDEAATNQRKRQWRLHAFATAREVTVGLMGAGVMGQAAAKGLMELGFNVIGWGRSHRPGLPFRTYAGAEEIGAFLKQTEILVSLLPSTPATRGLISGALLRKLRRDGNFGAPVFISAGRGSTVNEIELLAALRDGTLRAASLDVFDVEPLPQESPFWKLDDVVVTPHNAADSHPDSIVAAIAGEIARFEAGKPLLNPVDRARGY